MSCTLTRSVYLNWQTEQAFINSPILRYQSIGQSFHHTCHTSTKHKFQLWKQSVALYVNRDFPEVDYSGNIDKKGLRREEQNKFSKKVTLYSHAFWFQLNHIIPKVNWCTNKSKVKYPSLNTCQVTFLLNLFCRYLYYQRCQNHLYQGKLICVNS